MPSSFFIFIISFSFICFSLSQTPQLPQWDQNAWAPTYSYRPQSLPQQPNTSPQSVYYPYQEYYQQYLAAHQAHQSALAAHKAATDRQIEQWEQQTPAPQKLSFVYSPNTQLYQPQIQPAPKTDTPQQTQYPYQNLFPYNPYSAYLGYRPTKRDTQHTL